MLVVDVSNREWLSAEWAILPIASRQLLTDSGIEGAVLAGLKCEARGGA